MLLVRRSALAMTGLVLGFLSITLSAQTATPAKPATAVHRRVAPATPALPKNIPPVKALMKTSFALRYQDIKLGTGDEAKPGQFYSVNYTGWLASDGTKFDSSYDRGRPIEFPQGMKRVIIGWDEGFEGMKVGGKRRLFIPYQLAYGPNGRGPIPAKANLIFDIELMGVRDMNAPMPMAPRIVPQAAPPTAPTTTPGTTQGTPQPQAAPPTPPPAVTPQSSTAPASPTSPATPPKPE